MRTGPSTDLADESLDRLLTEAGCDLNSAEVEDLLAGIVAAPPSHDPHAWLDLVCPAAGAELVSRLQALAERMRAAMETALADEPDAAARLAALRGELGRCGLDGFVVPRADEHQGEFVAPRAERLAWLTGFTGSAGLAVVLADRAAIFVDGRYTLQVRQQVDVSLFETHHLIEQPATDWIATNLGEGRRLAFDPWLHTEDQVGRYLGACRQAKGDLVGVDDNPLDTVWLTQPPRPLAPTVPHEIRFAGVASSLKRGTVAERLGEDSVDAAVLSAPDSIAWLVNMRGGDIPNTPVALCFAVVDRTGAVDLFIDSRKLTSRLRSVFDSGVSVSPPDRFGAALDRLGGDRKRVLVDPGGAPSWITDRLAAAGAEVIRGSDPCTLLKACKNETELVGTRAAHIRDATALVRFLAWLSVEAAAGGVTEIEAADRLLEFRKGNELFHGVSFETISGAGPNGAIVHYRVDKSSNRRLAPNSVYLVDSGAQYLDGTTDVTRTLWVAGGKRSKPTAEVRDRFTRVLKGHIAIATARFPIGTTGGQLDTLARTALWQAGLDFDHGTGHGVGSYLGVHEGPQRIGKQHADAPLKPGMIVSNEPGYYKAGAYGIRIENLVAVRQSEAPKGGERELMEFETLTLAPIDRALIDMMLMTEPEIAWLDAYHGIVRETISPLVDERTASWLEAATQALGA